MEWALFLIPLYMIGMTWLVIRLIDVTQNHALHIIAMKKEIQDLRKKLYGLD